MIFYTIITLLAIFSVIIFYKYRKLSNTFQSFLRNNNSTNIYELGLASASHWMFAIAIFFGTSIAYKFGIIGILYFAIPNILSLVLMGFIVSAARKKDKNANSLIEFIKQNCSKRVAFFFQIELIILALSALTLTFIAIQKIYTYSGFEAQFGVNHNYIILIVLLLTLIQALSGGIKTSIVSGSIQGILWIVFCLVIIILLISNKELSINHGTKNLTYFFDESFLKTFGIFSLISLTVGATSHGSLWMKSYSRKNPNQHKSYYIAAVVFGIIIITILFTSMSYVLIDPSLKDEQISIVKSVEHLGGNILLSFLVLLVIFHSSSLIDAYSNYCSNLITVDNKIFSNLVKVKFFTLVMIFGAYLIFYSNISIWYVFGFMSIARIVNFFPLIHIVYSKNINEPGLFRIIFLCLFICFGLFFYGKLEKIPEYEMWSAILAFFIPLILIQLTKNKN
jgi:Na+/proline symporter